MTVAKRPEDFGISDTDPRTREGWFVADRTWESNPKHLLTRDDWAMLDIWKWTLTGDFGGARPLPDRGGIQDQAAIMMDALAVMDHELQRLRTKKE